MIYCDIVHNALERNHIHFTHNHDSAWGDDLRKTLHDSNLRIKSEKSQHSV